MSKQKSCFKCLKSIIKPLDFFGVQFGFDYKYQRKYKTSIGGLIYLLLLILLIFMICRNASSFLNRQNFTSTYYTLKLSKTDEISIKNYSSNIAFKFNCKNVNDTNYLNHIKNDFLLTASYITENDGEVVNNRNLKLRNCTKEDFYYNSESEPIYIETVNKLLNQNYICLDSLNIEDTIQGIYNSDIFTYFRINLSVRDGSDYDSINKLLIQNQCVFQIYYIEDVININNYEQQVEKMLQTNYIIIKPTESIEANIYFKTQEFNYDNNWIFESIQKNYHLAFDYWELFNEYKGLDRYKDKSFKYDNLLDIYIRASLSKFLISRKYMKITEFIAEQTSIFGKACIVALAILTEVNYFFAYKSIIKKFFKLKNFKSDELSTNIMNEIRDFLEKEKNDEMKRYYSSQNNNIENTDEISKLKKCNTIINSNNIIDEENSNDNDNEKNEQEINNNNNNDNNDNNNGIVETEVNLCNKENSPKILNTEASEQLLTQKKENKIIELNEINNNKKIDSVVHVEKKRVNLFFDNKKNNGLQRISTFKQPSNFISFNKSRLKNRRKVLGKSDLNNTTTKKSVIFFNKFQKTYLNWIIFYYICPCFKKKDDNPETYRIVEQNFFVRMDIRSYIKSMQIIDMLNYIVLGKGNSGLVNFCSNPFISFSNVEILDEQDYNIENFFNIDKDRIKKFLNNLSEIMHKDSPTNLDIQTAKCIISELESLVGNTLNI